jgi:hypothetical protein
MATISWRPAFGTARTVLGLSALAALLVLETCTRDPSAPGRGITASVSNPLSGGIEGEFFGNIWSNGVVSRDAAYYMDLEPSDQATANRLRYYNATTWADTSVGHTGGARWMYEWSDPKAGGNCGNLATYLAGDTTKPFGQGGRSPEVHWPAPNVTPAGVEKHCIRPGTYLLTIRRGGSVTKQLRVDYLPIVPLAPGANAAKLIWNVTAQSNEALEALNYDDTTSVWQDLVVQADLTGGSYSETRVLDVENALSNPAKDTFVNVAAPSGTQLDYFRFSVARDTSTWNVNNQGTMLTRLFWKYGVDVSRVTAFYDAGHTVGLSIIRPHAFNADVTQSGTDTVAVELMRPDEQPDSAATTKRTIQVTLTSQPLTNVITGPDIINVTGSYSWLAVASGGIPPYSYGAWYYYRYPGPEQQVGTGQSYGRTVTVEPSAYVFRLRNLVTDQTPQTKQAKYFVEVFPAGGFAASAGDGVLFADGSCKPRPTDRDAHQAWLAAMFDQHKNVEPCHLR